MEKKLFLLFIMFSFLNHTLLAQDLPAERRVDWTLAGIKDTTTSNFKHVYLEDFGVVGNGRTLNDSAMQFVLSSVDIKKSILHFAEGNYLFQQNIVLPDSVVVRGTGSGSTILTFDMDKSQHSFNVRGKYGSDTISFSKSAQKDNFYINVDNAKAFKENDWIQIFQEDSDIVVSEWAYFTVGQIVQIESVFGDSIVLKSPLRLDYDIIRTPSIAKMKPVKNVGIECLKILRLDNTAPFQSSNINFKNAVNCWVRGVESEYCTFSHIQVTSSSNIQISNCYFHEAFEYGGGGRAYGVMLQNTATECLIENSIFKHLRHSMIIQAGSNGNVFAYNYSIDPFRVEIPYNVAGDLVLHGNYAYANLFEGNICQNLSVDDSHGQNGRYNTFFRNRAEFFGIYFTASTSPYQNLIGNEVTYAVEPISTYNYEINGIEHFLFANNNKGKVIPDSKAILVDESYAYTSKPSFIPLNQWAKIGNPDLFNLGSIPAKDRYLDDAMLNANCVQDEVYIEFFTKEYTDLYKIFPNPFNNAINILCKNEITKVQVVNALGEKVLEEDFYSKSIVLETYKLIPGVYFVRVFNTSKDFELFKLVKN